MNRSRTSFLNLGCLTSIVLVLVASACSRGKQENVEMNRADLEAKLNSVLQQIIARADTKDQEVLRAAQLFKNLQSLPADIVGFSVPINGGSNRAHISFTLDHFQRTPPGTLAAEGLEDLQTAKANRRRGPKD